MTTSVGILAGLDANCIVPNIKARIHQDYVFTGFYVYAVSIGGIVGVANGDVLDNDILAPERMDIPASGVLEGGAFQEHSFAVLEGDHHGAEEGFDLILREGLVLVVETAGGEAGTHVALVRIPDFAVF